MTMRNMDGSERTALRCVNESGRQLEAALFEGNANPFFASPCDMAWMLNGIAADHENEVIWYAKRAGDFKGCSSAR